MSGARIEPLSRTVWSCGLTRNKDKEGDYRKVTLFTDMPFGELSATNSYRTTIVGALLR